LRLWREQAKTVPCLQHFPGVGLARYWDTIIMEIQRSAWWMSPEPHDGAEREAWKARAAYLDSLFYDYSGGGRQ